VGRQKLDDCNLLRGRRSEANKKKTWEQIVGYYFAKKSAGATWQWGRGFPALEGLGFSGAQSVKVVGRCQGSRYFFWGRPGGVARWCFMDNNAEDSPFYDVPASLIKEHRGARKQGKWAIRGVG